MKKLKLFEASVYTDDLVAARRFYEEVLGLDCLIFEPPRHAFFRTGRGMLLVFNPAATAQGDEEVPPHGAQGPVHVALSAPEEELAGWASRLQQAGVEIRWADWPGGRSFFFRDPAGNLLEIASSHIWDAANDCVVEVFTDGSADDKKRGGWAALLRYGDHEKMISGAQPQTTNNRMELTAAVKALLELKRPCQVTIYTDSQYLKKAFSDGWLDKWQKNGWRTASKQPVKNKDLWMQLLKETQRHKVEWRWTRGHAGHRENELVDKEAQRQRRTLPAD